jgi:hypothetical protein
VSSPPKRRTKTPSRKRSIKMFIGFCGGLHAVSREIVLRLTS